MSNTVLLLWSVCTFLGISSMILGYSMGHKEGYKSGEFSMNVEAVTKNHGYWRYVSGKGLVFQWYNLDNYVSPEEIDHLFNPSEEVVNGR